MRRFALHNRVIMEQSPLQVYSSALLFTPAMSIVRSQFTSKMPPWIKRGPKVDTNWSPMLQTLEGHSEPVSAIAFSPNGKQLASSSHDRTVRLWDTVTGATLQLFQGHSDTMHAVAFPPDGKQLASCSSDETMWVCDAATGATVQIFEGHLSTIFAVAFSPDGKQLASGSDDRTVRYWDMATGTTLQILEGHSDAVSLSLSPPMANSWRRVQMTRQYGSGMRLPEWHYRSSRATRIASKPSLFRPTASSWCPVRAV
jgi:WD40 repeat protein